MPKAITIKFMKEVNAEANAEVFSGIDCKGKIKKQKPLYKRCTWYPFDCNAVGCDFGQYCRDFKEDTEWG